MMKRGTIVLGGGVAVVLTGLFVVSCGQEAIELEGQTRSNSTEISADTVEPDGKSATAILLRWEKDTSDEVGSEFLLRVTNTIALEREVSLYVIATSPTGQEREQALRTWTVRADSTDIVPVKLAQLPFQSSEYSTAVIVGARYAEGLDGESPRTVNVFAEARYVTSSPDFTSATARYIGAEAGLSGARAQGKSSGKEGALRIRFEGQETGFSSERIGPETEEGVYSIHDGPSPSELADFAKEENER